MKANSPLKTKYDNKSINITHEFPLQFYLDGFAEKVTSYDYCLVHRYIANKEYREYMKKQVKKGRVVYLDNSLYELGSSWDSEDYAKVIQELKPTYYMLPDVFDDFLENIKSQILFYGKYKSYFSDSTPIIIPHANTLEEGHSLLESIRRLTESLPSCWGEGTMIALPFGDYSFLNKNFEAGYANEFYTSYTPHLQSLNRGIFLKKHWEELKYFKIHLLGCKGLGEFTADLQENEHDKSNVISLDTSLPVAFTLENPQRRYNNGEFVVPDPFSFNGVRMPYLYYKSSYLIDKHFEDKFSDSLYDDLLENINYFQNEVNRWKEN